jgi:hypothetical protein
MRYIALLAATVALTLAAAGNASAKSHHVLLVGSYHGKPGQFETIQSAVDAAQPGDWVLVGPGDYKATVRIKTPDIHLRGMNRNSVVVDGTKSGPACSSKASDQNFKRGDEGNGIVAFKADSVWIQNLTACNFLGQGNQIWWNGGDGSGKVGMGAWYGSYLSTTTSYYSRTKPEATYGLFVSNASGPGLLSDTYGSNMNDASYYIGACQKCNAKMIRAHGEHSALGYSGTNSGGVLIEDSEFNDNTSGIVTNSQNNDDAPSPQQNSSFRRNYVHDNNNPNVPQKGTAESLSVVGAGIIVSGGRSNTVSLNRVENNGSWGILNVPFLDIGKPPPIAHCQGGSATKNADGTTTCLYDDWGNAVLGNKLSGNGFFGNPTNGDLGDVSGLHTPGNCYKGNTTTDGKPLTSTPADLQTTHADCKAANQGDSITSELASQLICAGLILGPCANDATHNYPRATNITVKALPKEKTMPNPCRGVPANAWCAKRSAAQTPLPVFTG